MRSKSALTSRAVRCGVPLKTMCSRKCVTPETPGVSSRLPVLTKNPSATERAAGLVSPTRTRRLGSVWVWYCMSLTHFASCFSGHAIGAVDTNLTSLHPQRLGPQRHDGEIPRRHLPDVGHDPLRR